MVRILDVAPVVRRRSVGEVVGEVLHRSFVGGVLGAVGAGTTALAAALSAFGVHQVLGALGAFAGGGSAALGGAAFAVGSIAWVFAAFFLVGTLQALDPRLSLEEFEKQDASLPWWLDKLVENVLLAGFGAGLAAMVAVPLDVLALFLGSFSVLSGAVVGLGAGGMAALNLSGALDEDERAARLKPSGEMIPLGRLLKAKEVLCPYCSTRVEPWDEPVSCSTCETLHHRECWLEAEACTTYGCGQRQALPVQAITTPPLPPSGGGEPCSSSTPPPGGEDVAGPSGGGEPT